MIPTATYLTHWYRIKKPSMVFWERKRERILTMQDVVFIFTEDKGEYMMNDPRVLFVKQFLANHFVRGREYRFENAMMNIINQNKEDGSSYPLIYLNFYK